jgi:hypothetical protein
MIRCLGIRICQVHETLKQEGLSSIIKKAVFSERESIPTQKDLSTVKPMDKALEKDGLELVEISSANCKDHGLKYPIVSRYLKVRYNVGKGFGAYALVKDGEVIGDVWFVTKKGSKLSNIHPDIGLLNITLGDEDVYLFDLYVTPEARVKSPAIPLLGSALNALRENGYKNAYGFFNTDNVPALWVHRMMGYKELPKVTVRNILFVKRRV